MGHSDIIILTTIVSVFLVVFIVAAFREFAADAKTPFKGGKEKGPCAEMIEFVGKIFSDESIEPKEKKELLTIIKQKIIEIDNSEPTDAKQ